MTYGITLKTAQEQLEIWLEASKIVATGQSYKIGTQSLTRANLSEILKQIKYWQGQVNQLSRRGRNRMYRAVPRDL